MQIKRNVSSPVIGYSVLLGILVIAIVALCVISFCCWSSKTPEEESTPYECELSAMENMTREANNLSFGRQDDFSLKLPAYTPRDPDLPLYGSVQKPSNAFLGERV